MDNIQLPVSNLANPNLVTPGDLNKDLSSISSISKILNSISEFPNMIRHEFKGEMLYEDDKGNSHWVQKTKPMFIKIDYNTGKPKRIKQVMPWKGRDGKKEVNELYVANEEAIEEVISIMKFAGINQINPVAFNTEENFLEDLKEFECKLSGLLALKQKEWGIDKELLPMIQFKIKTIIQDVRLLSVKGKLLQAIQTTVSRVEQFIESDTQRKKGVLNNNPY